MTRQWCVPSHQGSRSRKSVRAFKSDPVPKSLLAPNTFDSQPWRVYSLTGKAKDALSDNQRISLQYDACIFALPSAAAGGLCNAR